MMNSQEAEEFYSNCNTGRLCPHCGKELVLKTYVVNNAMSYSNTNVASTVCCNKPVLVAPERSFSVREYDTNLEADDWGRPFAKKEVK